MMGRLVLLAFFAAGPRVDQLAWMAGCWAMQSDGGVIEEQWTRPAGGAMLGVSRMVKNGRMVFHEFMRIEEKGGVLIYTPRIGSGAPTVVFRAASAGASAVAFENPAHDFPQRIVYRRQPDGLHATVDGVDKGKPRAENFPYRRTSCP